MTTLAGCQPCAQSSFPPRALLFFFLPSSVPLPNTQWLLWQWKRKFKKKTHTHTHTQQSREARLYPDVQPGAERKAVNLPGGACRKARTPPCSGGCCRHRPWINRPSLCTLWEGVGLVPRSCFSSLTLFPRRCGVPNAQRKTVRLSTGHVSVVPRKLQGARPMEHERGEKGSQEGWSGYPRDTKANPASWLPPPPLGGLCLLLEHNLVAIPAPPPVPQQFRVHWS